MNVDIFKMSFIYISIGNTVDDNIKLSGYNNALRTMSIDTVEPFIYIIKQLSFTDNIELSRIGQILQN